MPEASRGADSGGMHAAAALPRGGGRRQRGNLAMHHRCPLWSAGRPGRFARNAEQLHLWQRALPVLRNSRMRLGIRAGGRRDELGPFAQTEMAAGDVFVIETPGGGGYGPAAEYNRT